MGRAAVQLPLGLDGPAANAVISPCRQYRYALSRRWSPGERVIFVMLNPSTADAHEDNPTLRKCMAFARRWGFGGLWLGNLFAWRSWDPQTLKTATDPIGPHNDAALTWMAEDAATIVLAWGAGPGGAEITRLIEQRAETVQQLLLRGPSNSRTLLHIGEATQAGHPRHPLYLAGNLELIPHGLVGAEQPRS